MSAPLLLVFGILIVAGTFASKISSRSGIPVLLIFLAIGMIAGSDVLNLIYFDNYEIARDLANFALMFILFDSGFNTKRANLKKYFGPSLTLATVGIIVTALCLGVLIHFLLKMDWLYSFLIGSIISSTDAAAVMTIMRERPVKSHVSSTLEIESAANDPMAILLTLFMVNLVQNAGSAAPSDYLLFVARLAWQFGGGILTGFVLSKVAVWLFNHFGSGNQAMFYVLYVGSVLSIYSTADIMGANGTIAVFFAGYWMGNTDFVFRRGVSHFISGVSSFANMFVFLLLGILVFPRSVAGVWQEGLILAAALIFIARPVTVFLCTAPFRFSFKDRLFISWGGLKGAVPVVLATYPAAFGLDPDSLIFNIVFFVVALSCLLQGTTLSFLAEKLGLSVSKQVHSPYSLELFALDKTEFDVVDVQIHEDSPWSGKRLAELSLPEDIVVSSMVRDGKILSPRGNTLIHNDDILFIMGSPDRIEQVVAGGGAETTVAELHDGRAEDTP
ncbi:potassium/proton antiporter [Treponema brennaborense]|uniref:Sodium/hydrogen exchanger n=1 Tax=Treponema brennaborense (strain DSM 12168 / CIP 105900 / DD5/3) TaxID=906968 RepID=F4LP28_TREBD|nr:potassium/proton antiporter [Treponema brennaborense]AEE15904.1 sodium/hydrogen exchanger [Treponema brennaborense DSM 12168]